MATAKREKTRYAGVTFRMVARFDGYGEERMYYILYRRGGRGSKEIEEPVGRESESMTASKANRIRAMRAAGIEQANTERRKAEEAARLADESRVTVASLWKRYEEANAGKPSIVPDRSYYKYLSGLSDREPASLKTEDVDALRHRLAGTKSPRLKDGKAVPLAAQTQKHVLGLLRRLVHFGVKRDLFPMPQHLHFEMPRVDNEKTEVLTDEQLSATCGHLTKNQTRTPPRFYGWPWLRGCGRGHSWRSDGKIATLSGHALPCGVKPPRKGKRNISP